MHEVIPEVRTSEQRMDILRSQGLWFPGDQLVYDLQSPEPHELRTAFQKFVRPDAEIISLEDSLSALTVPDRPITGYAILDIHDTVTDLSGSLQMLEHGEPVHPAFRNNNHDYGEGLYFDDSDRKLKAQFYRLIHTSEVGLRTVPRLTEIKELIQGWRKAGIYTGFITSLTAGSELPVVSDFIGKYFAGNCDFVIIPDGHYDVADKGAAARLVIEQFGYREDMPVIAIDDIPGNTRKYRDALKAMRPKLDVMTVQPFFPSHMEPDSGSEHTISSYGAFNLAHQFVRHKLGGVALS